MPDQNPESQVETNAPSLAEEAAPAGPIEPEVEHSPGLEQLFGQYGISLLISTYQAGKLVLARKDGDAVTAHYRKAPRPMGVAIGDGQIAVGVQGEIVFYENVAENCRRLEPPDKHDACFVQRYAHLTGAIDIHEMAFGADQRIWFINTRFSALCTIDGSTSFAPVWRPRFISAYAAEDRCHLNGLGMRDGRPRYVTALGESDTKAGWREHKADGGVLIDLATGETLLRGLSMPHSPRWYADHLWVCESGKGTLSRVDPATGELKAIFKFPGFTRGLDFHGPLAFVGISQVRDTAFVGIPIAEEERNCGVWIVNILDGTHVGTLRFTQGVHEIFAVQVLANLRFPELLEKNDLVSLETYFLPPEMANESRTAP